MHFNGTFRHKESYGAHFWSVDPLGDPNTGHQKLGWCDLLYGLGGQKFSYSMHFNGTFRHKES